MKISKNGLDYYVNAYEGNFFGKLFRASVNFALTFYIDNFWENIQKGRFEEDTFQIFDKFLDNKHSIIDIGAWRGPMALYACQRARHCYAVEPDPVSFHMLQANIDLNQSIKNRITPIHAAITGHTGKTAVSARFLFGQTITSTVKKYPSNNFRLDSFTFPDLIKKYKINDCNFIKIDTEGAEAIILPKLIDYLKQQKTTLYLSFHPQHFLNMQRDIETMLRIAGIYKYIYSTKGEILGLALIKKRLLKKDRFDILLTDRVW